MGRRSQWVNAGMWEYCAGLRRGGKTVGEIQGMISSSQNRKRFGLLEIPSEDTILYQLKKRQLLDRHPSPLPPEELAAHLHGLRFLTLGIRHRIDGSGVVNNRIEPLLMTLSSPWCGFAAKPHGRHEAKLPEQEEIHEAWDGADPRLHPQYSLLVRHLSASFDGDKVVNALNSVYRTAAEFTAARRELLAAVTNALQQDAELSKPVLNTLTTAVMQAVSGPSHPRLGLGLIVREAGAEAGRARKVVDAIGDDPLCVRFRDALRKLAKAQKDLASRMSDSVYLRRLIQEGECQVCSADDLKKPEPVSDQGTGLRQ